MKNKDILHPSELVLHPSGAIYHLNLHPEQIGHKIIIAGDPGRIKTISSHFDSIEHKVSNREFVTHTGYFNNQKITALATGIGTDNIDIVLNELDALVNVNLKTRQVKDELNPLEIVRIGTCGSIQEDVPADKVVISTHALGLDGLLNFYNFEMDQEEADIHNKIIEHTGIDKGFTLPYLAKGSSQLISKIGKDFISGITITAPGFYAPQGRSIRLKPKIENLNERFRSFKFDHHRLVNYEMETSALYGLSRLMGHQACTVCAVVANRYANSFSKDYKPIMADLIEKVLNRLTK